MKRHIAIKTIDEQAQKTELADIDAIKSLLEKAGIDADLEYLKHQLLYACDVTINFHPDRFSNNRNLIIDNLLIEGMYHNQYKTGTSNGGRTAHLGGDRDLWEERLFSGAYHRNDIELVARPKYGALNIHNYIDGASARFGSCFFTLKPHVLDRCTFAFGDSSTNPQILGTVQHFWGIVKALLQQTSETGRFLNTDGLGISQTVEYILSMKKDDLKNMGYNLDQCVETHVHGVISLQDDIASLYLDRSYVGTNIEPSALLLTKRYDLKLCFIPDRRYPIDEIDDEWKGPLAKPLAERIAAKFGDGERIINASLIGLGSQDSVLHPHDWLDIGTEFELFQNFKYLWHYASSQKKQPRPKSMFL